MLLARTHNTVASLVIAGWCAWPAPVSRRPPLPSSFSGAITGFVTDAAGVPQMGATVLLFNRQERQFRTRHHR